MIRMPLRVTYYFTVTYCDFLVSIDFDRSWVKDKLMIENRFLNNFTAK